VSGADELAAAQPQPPKQDPETLVLRGRPRPVVRFRKGLIMGLAAAASASLIGLAWISLKPPSFQFVQAQEGSGPAASPSLDALAGAPKAYSDVPRLGPPLPGDLGRPILERQRELDADRSGARPDASVERQRKAAEEQSARSSAVLVQLAPGPAPKPGPRAELAEVPAALPVDTGNLSAPSQLRKEGFVRSSNGDINPHALSPAPSPWTLSAGTVIPASLVTGLNSDLPGLVIAQVTADIRDSATGAAVLVPQGARLIGRYDSSIAFGQKRALLVWQRILFPDGSSVALDNMPASDSSGYAGLEDRVDFHEWRLVKGIALSTLLATGNGLGSAGGERDLAEALRQSAGQDASRAGDAIVSRNLDVQPTLTVRPGWPVRLLLNKDLVLKPWNG
jgi:type IV secretion system protein VirB10